MALPQCMNRDRSVLVLTHQSHFRVPHSNETFGRQPCCRQMVTKSAHLFHSGNLWQVRLAAAIPVIGLALLAGCGGQARKSRPPRRSSPRRRARPAPPARSRGSARRSSRMRRSSARRPRSPAGRRAPAFARFGRLNVNGVPTIFSIRGARVDAGCKPRAVPGADPEAAERGDRVGAGPAGRRRAGHDADRRRPVGEAGHALSSTARRVLSSKAAIGAPATPTPTGSFYVNQRLIPDRQERPVRPGSGRRLGVLERPHRLDAGRADRDPRDQRAVVDREGRLERLHPDPERGSWRSCSRRRSSGTPVLIRV